MARWLKYVMLSTLTAVILINIPFTPPVVTNVVKLGEAIVFVTDEAGTSGGTGFHVLSNGQTYVITNHHVCANSTDGTMYLRHNQTDRGQARKILFQSSEADLCVIEKLDDKEALELGESPSRLQHVWVLGHPHLMDLALTDGRVIARTDVQIAEQVQSPDQCQGPKKTLMVSIFGLLCLEKDDVIMTSVPGQPGNSGSPLLDADGKVVGVVVIGSAFGWLGAVPLPYLKSVLELLK